MHIVGDFVLGLINLFLAPLIILVVVSVLIGKEVELHTVLIHLLRLIKHSAHFVLKLVEGIAEFLSTLVASIIIPSIDTREGKTKREKLESRIKTALTAMICIMCLFWVMDRTKQPTADQKLIDPSSWTQGS